MKKQRNKLHQRLLALALALMLCVSMLPMAAFAEGEEANPTEITTQADSNPEQTSDPVEPDADTVEPTEPTEPAPGAEGETPNQGEGETPAEGETPNQGEDNAPVEDKDKAPTEGGDNTPAEDEGKNDAPAEPTEPKQEAPAEEVPAQVQAFLDAVAAIPAITPENVLEAAEYVYGPVSEAYEALLGTEYEERADVQGAVVAYAAAIAAVDAALNMESDDYAYGYSNTQNIELFVGQTVHHVFRPANSQGFLGNNYTGQVFCLDNVYNTANCLSVGEVAYQSKVDTYNSSGKYTGIQHKVGVATLKGKAAGYCTVGYTYYYLDSLGNQRIGYQGYNITVKPTTQTFEHELNLKVGESEDVEIGYAVNNQVPSNLQVTTATSQNTSIATVDTPSLNQYNGTMTSAINGVGSGTTKVEYQAKGNLITYSLLGTCNSIAVTFNDIVSVNVERDNTTTYTVTYTDGVVGQTVFADQGYEGLKEGDDTPEFVGELVSYTDNDGNTYTFQGWSPAVNPKVSANDANEDGNIVYTATWQKQEQLKNLTVSKTPSEEYPVVGEEFYYTITATNPNSKEIKVTITDVLDTKLDFVAAGDDGTYDAETRTVTWTNVTVPANGSRNVTVYVKANTAGEIYNEAKITWEDKEASGNTTVTAKEPEYTFTVIHHDKFNSDKDTTPVTNMPDPYWQKKVSPNTTETLTLPDTVPQRAGFTFQHWQWGVGGPTYQPSEKITLTVPDGQIGKTADLCAVWVKNPVEPETANYTVTWYDADSGEILPAGVKVNNPETRSGTVDKTVSVTDADKSIDGYTFKENDSRNVLSETLAASGNTALKLYFTKNPVVPEPTYTVTYNWSGLPANSGKTLPATVSYTAGAEVTVDTNNKQGDQVTINGKTYTFSGWNVFDPSVDVKDGKFAMPASNVTIHGEWKPEVPTEPENPIGPEPPPVITTRNLTVNKLWVGDEDAGVRPDSIQVQLYQSGAAYGSPVTLSAGNGWSHTWIGLSTVGTLTVEELNIPEGYTATQVNSGSTVTITNTYKDEEIEDPDVPLGTPEPTPTPTPAPSEKPTPGPSATPDPDEEIPDPDVPLGTPKPEPTPDPDEEIPDENVPLGTPKPVKPSEPDDGEEIPDEKVPLAKTPKTGDDSGVWMTLALISAAGLVFLGISRRKKGENVR